MVQEVGYAMLRRRGIDLIAAAAQFAFGPARDPSQSKHSPPTRCSSGEGALWSLD
jgi:hypothetical protein